MHNGYNGKMNGRSFNANRLAVYLSVYSIIEIIKI